MIPLVLITIFTALMVIPSPRHVRDDLEIGERAKMECAFSVAEGRRSGFQSGYAARSDLDLLSGHQILTCRQMILTQGLRTTEADAILAQTQTFVTNLSDTLLHHQKLRGQQWHIHVAIDTPGVSQKVAFALRTQLAEVGLTVHNQVELARTSLPHVAPAQFAERCRQNPNRPNFADLYVFRSTVTSNTLRGAVCADSGWIWL